MKDRDKNDQQIISNKQIQQKKNDYHSTVHTINQQNRKPLNQLNKKLQHVGSENDTISNIMEGSYVLDSSINKMNTRNDSEKCEQHLDVLQTNTGINQTLFLESKAFELSKKECSSLSNTILNTTQKLPDVDNRYNATSIPSLLEISSNQGIHQSQFEQKDRLRSQLTGQDFVKHPIDQPWNTKVEPLETNTLRTSSFALDYQTSPISSSPEAPSFALLPGSRDSLFPVPKYCRPPLELFINDHNPLLSSGLARAGEHKLCNLEPKQEFDSSLSGLSGSMGRLDQLLLNVQTPEALTLVGRNPTGESKSLIGLLTAMCSSDEMIDKQRTSTANDFERLPATLQADTEARLVNRFLVVKSFQRSDANKVFKPEDVRSLVWCRKSVHNMLALHLSADCMDFPWHVYRDSTPSSHSSSLEQWQSSEIKGRRSFYHGYSYLDVYNFMRDRFRSVWQDLTVQHCSKHRGFIESLEISFRFLIMSEALLWGTAGFDSVQNGELMKTCLDKLMGGYQDIRYTLTQTNMQQHYQDSVIEQLINSLVYKSPYEAEFWAYRIIITLPHSLENSNALLDMHRKIPAELLPDRRIQLALATHRAFRDKNACRFFKLVKKADFLMAVLLQKYANLMRVVFLKALAGQFSRQRPVMPFENFCHQFGLDRESIDSVSSFCDPFGIIIIKSTDDQQPPLGVNMERILVTASDLHPKKSRCPQFRSIILKEKWQASGLTRQTLLDPEFPISGIYKQVLTTNGFRTTRRVVKPQDIITSQKIEPTTAMLNMNFTELRPSPNVAIAPPLTGRPPLPSPHENVPFVWSNQLQLSSTTTSSPLRFLSQQLVEEKKDISFSNSSKVIKSEAPIGTADTDSSFAKSGVGRYSIVSKEVSTQQLSAFGASLSGGNLPELPKSSSFRFPSPFLSSFTSPPQLETPTTQSNPKLETFSTSPAESQFPIQDPLPCFYSSSSTTEERHLSFAFEGLVTPPSSMDRPILDVSSDFPSRPLTDSFHQLPNLKRSESLSLIDEPCQRSSLQEPKFGISDSEMSETEPKRPGKVHQELRSETQISTPDLSTQSVVSTTSSVVQTNLVDTLIPLSTTSRKLKRPRKDSLDGDLNKSQDEEQLGEATPGLQIGRTATSIVLGAKRRLRESPPEQGMFSSDEMSNDASILVPPLSTATVDSSRIKRIPSSASRKRLRKVRSITVTSCLDDAEIRLNSEEISGIQSLAFLPNSEEATLNQHVLELMISSLDSVRWLMTLVCAGCLSPQNNHECKSRNSIAANRRTSLSLGYRRGAGSDSDNDLLTPSVSQSFDLDYTALLDHDDVRISNMKHKRHPLIPNDGVVTSRRERRRWRMSDRFAAIFGTRLRDNSQTKVTSRGKARAPFARRFLELLFLQFAKTVRSQLKNKSSALGSGLLWKYDYIKKASNQTLPTASETALDLKKGDTAINFPSKQLAVSIDCILTEVPGDTVQAGRPESAVSPQISNSESHSDFSDSLSKQPFTTQMPSSFAESTIPITVDLRCFLPFDSDALKIYEHQSDPNKSMVDQKPVKSPHCGLVVESPTKDLSSPLSLSSIEGVARPFSSLEIRNSSLYLWVLSQPVILVSSTNIMAVNDTSPFATWELKNSTWDEEMRLLQQFLLNVTSKDEFIPRVVILFCCDLPDLDDRNEVRQVEQAVHYSLARAWSNLSKRNITTHVKKKEIDSKDRAAEWVGNGQACDSAYETLENFNVGKKLIEGVNNREIDIDDNSDSESSPRRRCCRRGEAKNNDILHGISSIDIPWNFEIPLRKCEAEATVPSALHHSAIGCFCVARLSHTGNISSCQPRQYRRATFDQQQLMDGIKQCENFSREDSCGLLGSKAQVSRIPGVNKFKELGSDPCDCLIRLSSKSLEIALSSIRYWSQLGLIYHMRRIIERGKIDEQRSWKRDVQRNRVRCNSISGTTEENKNCKLFPEFVELKWKECESDSVALLLISSWKREVEKVSESVLPTFHSLIQLLDVAVKNMSHSPYLNEFFWNKISQDFEDDQDFHENEKHVIPVLVDKLSEAIKFYCIETLEATEDYSPSTFGSSGDFLFCVRRAVSTIVNNAIIKVGVSSTQPLRLTYPFWKEYDAMSKPPWNGFLFPPQCWGGWNILASASRNARTESSKQNLEGTRQSLGSCGTPPRGRRPLTYSPNNRRLSETKSECGGSVSSSLMASGVLSSGVTNLLAHFGVTLETESDSPLSRGKHQMTSYSDDRINKSNSESLMKASVRDTTIVGGASFQITPINSSGSLRKEARIRRRAKLRLDSKSSITRQECSRRQHQTSPPELFRYEALSDLSYHPDISLHCRSNKYEANMVTSPLRKVVQNVRSPIGCKDVPSTISRPLIRSPSTRRMSTRKRHSINILNSEAGNEDIVSEADYADSSIDSWLYDLDI